MAKKTQRIKFKRAPGAPRRFQSAYMFFAASQHRVIRQNSCDKKVSKVPFPVVPAPCIRHEHAIQGQLFSCPILMLRYLQIRSSDIAKLISRAWKELPETDKSVWHHKAQLDRQRYDREKAAFKGPWKVPIVKDPNAPKKPMSAFLDYANERRRFIAEANPTMNGTEISCLLARLWRECPDDVRQRYRDREARERKIYKERRAQWERQKRFLT